MAHESKRNGVNWLTMVTVADGGSVDRDQLGEWEVEDNPSAQAGLVSFALAEHPDGTGILIPVDHPPDTCTDDFHKGTKEVGERFTWVISLFKSPN